MLSVEELELLGYTDDIRELYLNEGSITIQDGMVIINDQGVLREIISAFLVVDFKYIEKLYTYLDNEVDRLYYEFIYCSLNGKDAISVLDELIKKDSLGVYSSETAIYYAILNETPCSVGGQKLEKLDLDLYVEKVIKYVNKKQYIIALEFVNAMSKRNNHYIIAVLKSLLSKKKDTATYILEDGIYPSDVTNDNLHRIEREALVTLETGDIIDFYDDMEVLEILYENQDPLPLLNINTMISAELVFEAIDTHVSDRSFSRFLGSFSSTIFELLRCQDYYRVDELIKQEKKEETSFSIYLEMLDIISSRIMALNSKNMNYVKRIVTSSNTGEKGLEEVIGDYPLSAISGDLLREYEENEYLSKEDNNNYYRLYLACFEDDDFKEALKALMKMEKKGKSVGFYINVDYLIKELKLYIANELESPENALQAIKERRLGDAFFEAGNYIKAILKYDKALSLVPYKIPKTIAQIARCYYNLNDYEKAYKALIAAPLDGLYPDDILMMLECMFKMREYSKMLKVFERLESISPKCNVRVYYMMSIVFIKLHKYNKAREMLNTAKELNYDYHNAVVDFKEEYNTISRCEKEKTELCYSMDDFIDFEMSEEEIDLSNDLDFYRYEYDESYIDVLLDEVKKDKRSAKDKILYLLSVIKIIIIQNESVNLQGIYDYLNELLGDSEISRIDQRQFTLAMKNYKKL